MRTLNNKYLAVVLALTQGVRQGDTYDVNMYDSYGDGWHGNTIAINGDQFGSSFTTGSSA